VGTKGEIKVLSTKTILVGRTVMEYIKRVLLVYILLFSGMAHATFQTLQGVAIQSADSINSLSFNTLVQIMETVAPRDVERYRVKLKNLGDQCQILDLRRQQRENLKSSSKSGVIDASVLANYREDHTNAMKMIAEPIGYLKRVKREIENYQEATIGKEDKVEEIEAFLRSTDRREFGLVKLIYRQIFMDSTGEVSSNAIKDFVAKRLFNHLMNAIVNGIDTEVMPQAEKLQTLIKEQKYMECAEFIAVREKGGAQ
jgi:hypothetical protein